MRARARLAIALILVSVLSTGAMAKNFNWIFQNSTGKTLNVVLYGKTRNVVWPPHPQVWILPPNGQHYTIRIACHKGEYICYGAWAIDGSNTYWGSGQGGTQGCPDCCYYCRGTNTQVINLIP